MMSSFLFPVAAYIPSWALIVKMPQFLGRFPNGGLKPLPINLPAPQRMFPLSAISSAM
jgi:hypothetical protein